ncbi:hypothetical protein [uncultured Stenotrophomonas sp.]|uniref:hypothetical protein n=1 Tax=uncultured Stenotrophomonas sp. TaxID=165438 RepID=UPI0025DC0D8C|nr:hypothetical protein [uncultured Stenotrophomonas sp.]
MHRLALLAFVALGLSPLAAAQSAGGYVLCTVTDTGHTPARVWASPVLEFNASILDMEAVNRVAGAFHRHVAGLGGAGEKSCVAMRTRAEAEALREEQHGLWDKRTLFVKVGKWHDVPWTLPADVLAAVGVTQAQPHFFRCHATATDVPGRLVTALTVSSGVFEKSVPGDRALAAALEQAGTYREAFKPVAQSAGIPAEAAYCFAYDTRAEADRAEQDYRRLIGGFNAKYDVVRWVPGDKAAVRSPAAAPPVAEDAGVERGRVGVRVGVVGAEQLDAPATRPEAGNVAVAEVPAALYCLGSVQRTKPALLLRTPIRQQPTADADPATLQATLASLYTAARQAYPGSWRDQQAYCQDSSSVFPGETMCISVSQTYMGGLQNAMLFCNGSREQIEARSRDMSKADGGNAQAFDWPAQ